MKTYFPICIIALAIFTSCSGNDNQKRALADSTLVQATRQQLMEAISERDQLIELVDEINRTTREINQLENIISINTGNGENLSTQNVNGDLQAIKSTLAERRKNIEELEKKLKSSKSDNSKLLSTIESLKQQIADQSMEIERLSVNLKNAYQQIDSLSHDIETLNATVDEVSVERDEAQMEAQQQTLIANACYYVVATKKELQEHNIVAGGGFLRKQKVMEGDFDKSFFIKADKRTLTEIPTYSQKINVLTKYQPDNSYKIVEENSMKVIKIINPDSFWGISNYFVVQVD